MAKKEKANCFGLVLTFARALNIDGGKVVSQLRNRDGVSLIVQDEEGHKFNVEVTPYAEDKSHAVRH